MFFSILDLERLLKRLHNKPVNDRLDEIARNTGEIARNTGELLRILESLIPVPAPVGVLSIEVTEEGENDMMIFTARWTIADVVPITGPAAAKMQQFKEGVVGGKAAVSRTLIATPDGGEAQTFSDLPLDLKGTQVGIRSPEGNVHLALHNVDNRGNLSPEALEADFLIPDTIGPLAPQGVFDGVEVTGEE